MARRPRNRSFRERPAQAPDSGRGGFLWQGEDIAEVILRGVRI
jgi:hypothetical protein